MSDLIRNIPSPTGSLEVLIDEPAEDPRALVVFAHPLPTHGGSMHTKMVFQGAKGLARAGCLVLRFNFRGVGRSTGVFDEGCGELDDFSAALDFVSTEHPNLEIWSCGASFGAYIAMTAGANDDRVSTLIGIAPPVNMQNFSIVQASIKPKFLVHGEADELIPVKTGRKFYAQMVEPKELVVIDGANHVFDGQASEVGDALEELLRDFKGSVAT